MQEFIHETVMLSEAVDGLNIKPQGIYVDGTLGGAGHSLEVVKRLGSGGRLIGIDRDDAALAAAGDRLSAYEDAVTLVKGNSADLEQILDKLGIGGIDGFLMDLGVSSPQLDDAGRGFSYMEDAPLDMRMDRSQTLTACDVVNGYSEHEIKRILYEFGEERYAPRIAAEIVKRRERAPIATTLELVDAIRAAMPAKALREKQHPAKRSFQAIRISVNSELSSLSQAVETVADRLNPGGRLAVISFHSLEDRIVKNAINSRVNGCICPPDFPQCVCGFTPTLRQVTKKPLTATEEEIERNPRARSAKLRVAERI